MDKQDLRDLSYEELESFVMNELEEKRFRARQIFDWIYIKNAVSFEEMSNLSRELREKLDEHATIAPIRLTDLRRSQDGTEKLQFTLDDGSLIESVVIPSEDRLTLCMSSQVGCAMGCAFCYTASLKLKRNLRTAEIVDQYRQALRHIGGDKERITNIVLMGMGEPLHNLEAVAKACNLLMDERGFNLSSRKVTVSTCGLVPEIARLADLTNVSLAVSLNATVDDVRSRIMPINRRYGLQELMDALDRFPKPRRKRIVLEYVLLRGVNDTPDDARRLARMARRIGCKVNLIPFNPHDASEFEAPEMDRVLSFQAILFEGDVSAFIRDSRGLDIHGACGMLGKRRP